MTAITSFIKQFSHHICFQPLFFLNHGPPTAKTSNYGCQYYKISCSSWPTQWAILINLLVDFDKPDVFSSLCFIYCVFLEINII